MRGLAIVLALGILSVAGCSGKGRGTANAKGLGGGGQSSGGSAPAGNAHGSGGAAGSTGTNANGGSGTSAKNGSGGGNASAGSGASAGNGGSAGSGTGTSGTTSQLGGCALFTADDAWNRDITTAAADSDWTSRLHALVGDIKIHPDYGNAGSEHYGMPINVVPKSQPLVPVMFDGYPDESDPGPYPFPDPASAKIEGGTPQACKGDCHFLVIQSGACMLYEGYGCSYATGWRCSNGAKWDLSRNSYGQRPKSWTSADAAGLAITPGVLRYDEVKSGEVRHAIRFTVQCTRANFVAPATHQAVPGKCSDPNAPPMGLRVRLRADYDLSKLSASAQVVARGMQHYGLMLADNGSNFYFQGEDNPGWTDTDVEPLKTIPASAFEALTPPPLEK